MPAIKGHHRVFIISLTFLLSAAALYAFYDSFDSSKKIEGKYVVVYYAAEANIPALVQKLNIRPSDQILAGGSPGGAASYEEELGRMLDALSVQVSDILGMRLPSLKINIKICRDKSQLKDIFKQMFNSDLQDKQSFYAYSLNTIYVSEESLKREILGHEIAHAIISNYFAVPTPVKMQEVLSMYVEYSLRRIERQ